MGVTLAFLESPGQAGRRVENSSLYLYLSLLAGVVEGTGGEVGEEGEENVGASPSVKLFLSVAFYLSRVPLSSG